ncbi:hypothetical protein [Streptomyces alboflavus]|uniref:hypothetical protein n=1 Tax=Streptomyces alboflavus TaxID=67267 RepID=UPI00068ED0D8|nr:hypothetical protein [Streptomyces alboflavus]
MSTTTLGEQAAAIAACSVLANRYAHLPAADLKVSAVITPHAVTQGVTVSVHDGLDVFEAWREALDISPDSLTIQHLPSCLSLEGWTFTNGVPVRLIGYGDEAPAPTTPLTGGAHTAAHAV